MVRFRNTLTKSLYYNDGGVGHFHNMVNGQNSGYADDQCSPNCPPDVFRHEVLDWMPLERYDDGSLPSAYEDPLDHTSALISSPNTQALGGAHSYRGLAEVVQAQWRRECVDLRLFNRDMVYDQDFNVKGRLIVQPMETFEQSASGPYYIPGGELPFSLSRSSFWMKGRLLASWSRMGFV